jgi:hypothetical protein
LRKRSTSGTQIVSFSCDSDLARKFKNTVDYGERSEYLENLLRTNIDSNCSYSCNTSSSQHLPTTRMYANTTGSTSWKPLSENDANEIPDEALRVLKRRLKNLKE